MRSLMTFAAFVAAIGFSGCCGTGGSCPLSHGKLGNIGSGAAKASAVQSSVGQSIYSEAGDCGCGAPSYDQGAMEYAPADGGCGCSAPMADSGAAACACGSDSVVSVSAPYDCGCEGGCGAAPVMSSMPAVSDGGCGCSSCGDSSAVVSPMQYSAPASGGCSACEGASNAAPSKPHRFLGGRGLDKSGSGMGMTMKDRGLACNSGGSKPCALGHNRDGAQRRAERQDARSLKPQRSKKTLADMFGFTGNQDASESVETIDLVSNDCVECGDAGGRHISRGSISDVRGAHQGDAGGRHISHGFISDVRGARQAHFGDRGVVGNGVRGGAHTGCLGGGCGQGGKLCGCCSKLRGLAGIGSGNPYGGAIPHTAQQPGQSGMAPQYAYPYYTTRGPRDFLRDNPPSIGR